MNDPLSQTFAALADPTRRAILEQLHRQSLPVGDLAKPFALSLPAISRHLKVLERAGLIERSVEAQWRRCRLKPQALKSIDDWLDRYRQFWEESLDRLDELVEQEKRAEGDRNNERETDNGRPDPRPRSDN
ncbi:MAG: ArsR/SmtB family transcription factor [Geminicoccaceae bacterium]